MAKFAQLVKGRLARKKGVEFVALDGTKCVVDLALLSGADDVDMLEAASAHARSKGAEAKRGDPVFEYACEVELVARACLDPESPEDKPERFFASADEVRANLDRDRIAYLAARQQEHQESLSPLKHELSNEQYAAKVFQILAAAEGDDGPFQDFALALLRSFARTLVRQVAFLQMNKSGSGTSTSVDGGVTTGSATSSGSAN